MKCNVNSFFFLFHSIFFSFWPIHFGIGVFILLSLSFLIIYFHFFCRLFTFTFFSLLLLSILYFHFHFRCFTFISRFFSCLLLLSFSNSNWLAGFWVCEYLAAALIKQWHQKDGGNYFLAVISWYHCYSWKPNMAPKNKNKQKNRKIKKLSFLTIMQIRVDFSESFEIVRESGKH